MNKKIDRNDLQKIIDKFNEYVLPKLIDGAIVYFEISTDNKECDEELLIKIQSTHIVEDAKIEISAGIINDFNVYLNRKILIDTIIHHLELNNNEFLKED